MEYWLTLGAAVLACLAVLAGRDRRPAGVVALGVLLVTAVGAMWLGERSGARDLVTTERAAAVPRQTTDGGYVSSDACRACHPGQYATWHATYHRTMTRPASADAIVAPFAGERLTGAGDSYRLGHDGDDFWVDTDGASRGRRQVVMVTGSHNQQRYWLRGEGGNSVDLLPFAYLIADRRWVPGNAIFLMPPSDDAPIAPRLWNGKCVACHGVAGQPGAATPRDVPDTRVAELGIACESCHGPGAEHVRVNADPLRRYVRHGTTDGDPTIVNPRRLAPDRASEVCGQCHGVFRFKDLASWRAHGPAYRPGDALDADRWVIRYEANPTEAWKRAAPPGMPSYMDQNFWPDGTVRISGREYNGLLESRCAQRGGLSCLSCHGLHGTDPDEQLAADAHGDAACAPCHDAVLAQGSTHTHHAATSEGSRCYNCHMPYTTLGLLKAIRSHRIDSPSVETSVTTGRPNACNLCHLDRTLAWTSAQLAAGWGVAPVALPEEEQRVSAALIWLLSGDAAQRELVAWHVGWAPAREASGTTWMAPFLAQLLDDPYAAVRYNAGRSLRHMAGLGDLAYDYVGPETERERARARVLAANLRPDRTGDAVLLDGDGRVQRETARDLLRRRDDRPVYLAE